MLKVIKKVFVTYFDISINSTDKLFQHTNHLWNTFSAKKKKISYGHCQACQLRHQCGEEEKKVPYHPSYPCPLLLLTFSASHDEGASRA
jgi:hypothetical protein